MVQLKDFLDKAEKDYNDLENDVQDEIHGAWFDAKVYFKNHKVACFVAAGIEILLIVGALAI